MKPNTLKYHFDNSIRALLAMISFADKETNYFKTNADVLMKAKFDTGSKYYQQDIASIEASFLEALRITKTMKPHTVAEDLLLSAAKDIGSNYNQIQVCYTLECRRINDMSADILDQVIQEIQSVPLQYLVTSLMYLQMLQTPQLLVYVIYINNGNFKDEFLICKLLETTNTICGMFDTVGSFLKQHEISWEKFVFTQLML